VDGDDRVSHSHSEDEGGSQLDVRSRIEAYQEQISRLEGQRRVFRPSDTYLRGHNLFRTLLGDREEFFALGS
jgi:hypothetical protein